MNNPFLGLVGLRGVDPQAELWVDDLPGICGELVADLSDECQRTESDPDGVRAVWSETRRLACEKLLLEVEAAVSRDDTFQPVLARTTEPLMSAGDSAVQCLTTGYFGLVLTAPPRRYSRMLLRTLTLVSEETGEETVTLLVADLARRAIVRERTEAVAPGYNTLIVDVEQPNSAYSSNRFFVGIGCRGLRLRPFGSSGAWRALAGSGEGYSLESRRLSVSAGKPVLGDAAPDYLFLDAEHSRTLADLLPRFRSDLKLAYLNLCGSLLLSRKLATPNLTMFTVSNRSFTDEYENRLMNEARQALRLPARRIAEELYSLDALTDRQDTDEVRIYQGSFV